MIIDAKNMIVGRIATVAAKRALLGEKVDIINCESAVITGNKEFTFSEMKRKRDMGTFKGPFPSRIPDRFVRRIVRGMLPFKMSKGKDAFKRVMCYMGVPKEFEGKEITQISGANISKLNNQKYVTIKEICKKLGHKQ
jgi:large subunit ribosomal protein L13